jgi:hypothetical protein
MFQDWCEHEGQKYVAQSLLSVPASSTIVIVHRQECLCHTSQIAIFPAIKAGASAVDGKSCMRVGVPRSARDVTTR